jgi:hypothetical protein
MSSNSFLLPAVQGGFVRQQPNAGNIEHFGWVEYRRRNEANRPDTPG